MGEREKGKNEHLNDEIFIINPRTPWDLRWRNLCTVRGELTPSPNTLEDDATEIIRVYDGAARWNIYLCIRKY